MREFETDIVAEAAVATLRPTTPSPRAIAMRWTAVAGCVALLALAAGCGIIGAAAGKVTRTVIKPAYAGLSGQSVGVMVTADRGTQIEYPRIQLDVAQSVQAKLQGAQKNKAEELKDTQFPSSGNPTTIFAWQRNHPEYDADPVEKVAPQFGVSRLIYVEIETLSLNPGDVTELFRGETTAQLKVVEVNGNATNVVSLGTVTAVFPDNAPPDGLPNLNRGITYRGLLDALGTAIVEKFIEHEEY